MAETTIREGIVSSYNAGNNSASIYYPDKSGQVTKEFPILAPGGMKQTLVKGESVLVAHLSNGTEGAVIIGPTVAGSGSISVGSDLTLTSSAGSITVSDLIKMKEILGV